MRTGDLGCIVTPKQGNRIPENVAYCADNGCFGKGYPGDEAWWGWVTRLPLELCEFVVAPDVVGDAAATLERSRPWLPQIRSLGVRAAFVAQDGLTVNTTPWDEFDVLFIGGSTDWKLGPQARLLAAAAKARGKYVHMGRVNSRRRFNYAAAIGCDSVDGTTLTRGPDVNLPIVLSWVSDRALFTTDPNTPTDPQAGDDDA